MAEKLYKTFWDFYPYYLTEHENTTCRRLHLIGTSLVILSFIAFIITLNWRFFAIIPVLGYGFAWVGHAFFEKNKPATFTYPLYSLGSDFVMFWHAITFRLPTEMQKAKSLIKK
jgi:hypothetical protein